MDRALLNKATSSDATPTPGYMYVEIVKITYAGPQACEQLEDYLLKKLPKDSAHVKLKCLRVIKQVCEKGKSDFKRSMQKRADTVKACLTFKGQQDPLCGDAPNKAVREEAEECLKVIFNSSHQNAYGQVARPQEMNGVGYNNEKPPPAYSSAYGGGGPSCQGTYSGPNRVGGVMQGVGNTDYDASATDAPTFLQRASDSAWAIASKVTGKLPKSLHRAGSLGGHADFNEAPLPGGPTWQPPPMPNSWQPAHQPANRWGEHASRCNAPQAADSEENRGQYETHLVDDLCAPGGARVALSQTVLETFCQKCETLDADTIAELLVQKLRQSDWQIKLKALCATEALVDASLDGITGGICERGFDAISACKDVPQCRTRAKKVLTLLGCESSSPSSAIPTAAAASACAAPVDLLDFGESVPATSSVDLVVELEPPSLFSGLGVHESPVQANELNLLDDMLSGPAGPSDLLPDFAPAPFVPALPQPAVPIRRDTHLDALSYPSRSSAPPISSLGNAIQMDSLSNGYSGYSFSQPIPMARKTGDGASAFNFIATGTSNAPPDSNFNFVQSQMMG